MLPVNSYWVGISIMHEMQMIACGMHVNVWGSLLSVFPARLPSCFQNHFHRHISLSPPYRHRLSDLYCCLAVKASIICFRQQKLYFNVTSRFGAWRTPRLSTINLQNAIRIVTHNSWTSNISHMSCLQLRNNQAPKHARRMTFNTAMGRWAKMSWKLSPFYLISGYTRTNVQLKVPRSSA